ncbi:MAG: helix-turn-helix domain-containing protein, partial [Pseudomonadota bacterium]
MVTTLNRRGKREGNAGEDDGRIATNLRTLLIIETIAKSGVPLSPTEINAHIGLPKQSIHRLCQTLVDEGFLIRDV